MIRFKPYKLEAWGGIAKSAVVLTSFTKGLTFTCTIQQRKALKPTSPEFSPRGHSPGCWRGSQEVSVHTLPYHISRLPSTPHCKCEGIAAVDNNEFCCFEVPLGCVGGNVQQTHRYKTWSSKEMSGLGCRQ